MPGSSSYTVGRMKANQDRTLSLAPLLFVCILFVSFDKRVFLESCKSPPARLDSGQPSNVHCSTCDPCDRSHPHTLHCSQNSLAPAESLLLHVLAALLPACRSTRRRRTLPPSGLDPPSRWATVSKVRCLSAERSSLDAHPCAAVSRSARAALSSVLAPPARSLFTHAYVRRHRARLRFRSSCILQARRAPPKSFDPRLHV